MKISPQEGKDQHAQCLEVCTDTLRLAVKEFHPSRVEDGLVASEVIRGSEALALKDLRYGKELTSLQEIYFKFLSGVIATPHLPASQRIKAAKQMDYFITDLEYNSDPIDDSVE